MPGCETSYPADEISVAVEGANDGPFVPMPEWEEYGATPIHADCPLVQMIDASHRSVETSYDKGLIEQRVRNDRLRKLNLHRIAIAQTQEMFGCPRKAMNDDEAAKDAKSFSCNIPAQRVEGIAFGMPDSMVGLLSRSNNGSTGF
jgi:hypothetical protein